MAWLVQEYEGEVHVIPDTEPGHVLSADCFCEPKRDREPLVVVHRDAFARATEMLRIVER